MKKKNRFLVFVGIMIIVASFGFVACDDGSDNGINTKGEDYSNCIDPITDDLISYGDWNGKVYGVPYSVKEYTGVGYHYLITISYDEAEKIIQSFISTYGIELWCSNSTSLPCGGSSIWAETSGYFVLIEVILAGNNPGHDNQIRLLHTDDTMYYIGKMWSHIWW